MSKIIDKLMEDQRYLCRILEKSEKFSIDNKDFYYYNFNMKNYILFFGSSLPANYFEFLSFKYITFELLIFHQEKLFLNSN